MNNCNYSPKWHPFKDTLEILNFSKIHVLCRHMTGSESICAQIVIKICTLILSIFWTQPQVSNYKTD